MPIFPTPYPHVLNALNGPSAPKHTFLVFYSNVEDGQMWCPDCRKVDATVKQAFDGEDKPKAIIYWVGSKAEWRTPENKARVDWNVHNVPTILRIEDGKETARLVEDDILDSDKLQSFIYPNGQ
ncbi:hypothetical protein DB88DRAFT_492069 [Papiliotrema laurentii]|uniref:Thioredoxin domain-containing protein n=1 Tax=Papiliotrema laurentii TaxID=5418 RepID=A0AAD9CXC6_PAPLA|nr:hypothetical protein DB88DRAFT_492069 [Papiliotrema laurentii]